MNMLLSLPQHLKVNYFANVRSEKWQKVDGGSITAVQSINEVRFMKLKVSQTCLKHAIPDFADKLLLFHFNRTNLSVFLLYEYALYSAFQL